MCGTAYGEGTPWDWEEGVGVIGKFKKTVFFLTWPIFVVSLMEEIYIF